uniref:Uncharacterized protein n=1 Tax=Lygus hesperus TaxID=30085 RepID=A0A146LKQ9_LYGHE
MTHKSPPEHAFHVEKPHQSRFGQTPPQAQHSHVHKTHPRSTPIDVADVERPSLTFHVHAHAVDSRRHVRANSSAQTLLQITKPTHFHTHRHSVDGNPLQAQHDVDTAHHVVCFAKKTHNTPAYVTLMAWR